MSRYSSQPIGIFDSGVGGLTLAKALTQEMPDESIVYFGDTAHVPWGDKSSAAIQSYSIKICELLLQQGCKLILIACNSASAVAYELAREYVAQRAMVVDVIEPMIVHLTEHYADKSIGLIGTKQTIHSHVYQKKLDQRKSGIHLHSLATPLLVPIIEEGMSNEEILTDALRAYLSEPCLCAIDALVLGCTHYPLIKPYIQEFYGHKTVILDSTQIVVKLVRNLLEHEGMTAQQATAVEKKFYVSDYTKAFADLARLFFEGPIVLERYPLWK